jgi:hypothetical protein
MCGSSYVSLPCLCKQARALQRLAAAADVLVPLSPLLLEMLHWSDLSKAPQVSPTPAPCICLVSHVLLTSTATG